MVAAMRQELAESSERISRLNAALSDERRKRLSEAERIEQLQAEREKTLSETFARREAELEARLRSQEERSRRKERDLFEIRSQFEAQAEARQKELDTAKAILDEKMAAFEIEVARYRTESQEKLQTNSKKFVGGMVLELREKETALSRISLAWSVLGGVILVLSVILLSWVTYLSVQHATAAMSWSLLTFYALKGSVLVAVAGVTSRYAFVMAANYMSEALRTADRVHAIKFGQFYVETYGAAATWEQVKETFSNWNSGGSGAWGSSFQSDATGSGLSDVAGILGSVQGMAKRD